MNSAKIASVLTGALGGGLVGAVGGGLGYEEDPLKGALVGGALGAGAGAGIGRARLRADTLANNHAVVSIGSNDLLHGKAQTARRGLEDIANANFVWHEADSPVREQLSRGINQHSRDASWATNELRDEAQLSAVEALIAQERLHATRAHAAHAATGLGIYGGARALSDEKTASILAGAGLGTVLGAVNGAYAAGEGHRTEGALGGATVGAAIGASTPYLARKQHARAMRALDALDGSSAARQATFQRVRDAALSHVISGDYPSAQRSLRLLGDAWLKPVRTAELQRGGTLALGAGAVSAGSTAAGRALSSGEEKTASVLGHALGGAAVGGGLATASLYDKPNDVRIPGIAAAALGGGLLAGGIRGKFTRVEDLINEPELSLALPAGSGIVSGGITSLALNPEFMSGEKAASVLRNTLGTSALAGGVGAYSGYQADTENPLRGALAGGAVGGALGAGAGYAKGRLGQALKEEALDLHAQAAAKRKQVEDAIRPWHERQELADDVRSFGPLHNSTLNDAFEAQKRLIDMQRVMGYVPASLALTSAAVGGSRRAGTALGETFSPPEEKTANDYADMLSAFRRRLPDYARDNPHVVAPILGASIGGLQGAAVANQNESDHPLASIAAGAATGGLVGLGAGYGARRGHQEAANLANEQLLNRLKHLGDPKSSRVDVNAFHDKAMDARAMLNDKALSGGWKAIGGAYGGGVLGGALGSVVTDAALHTPEEKTAAVLRRTFGV